MGLPDYTFGMVANSAVRSYELKFMLYIEKHMYVCIHIPWPLPLGESSPNNKVRKTCVFIKCNKKITLKLTLQAYCAEYGAALPP